MTALPLPNGEARLNATDAACRLARLMQKAMGLAEKPDSTVLKLFIQAYWKDIEKLAHAIHEGKERD